MRILFLAMLLALAGCATSMGALGEKSPDLVVTSPKPAEQVASCLISSLQWENQLLRLADGHFVIVRNSSYGTPIFRWDFIDTDAGSRAELRTGVGLGGSGQEKARQCAA